MHIILIINVLVINICTNVVNLFYYDYNVFGKTYSAASVIIAFNDIVLCIIILIILQENSNVEVISLQSGKIDIRIKPDNNTSSASESSTSSVSEEEDEVLYSREEFRKQMS